ncbi:MAG: 16S rRNA (guanine(527)-N(7))-methyltransferase RsmG [Oxalobacter sp.]
MDKNALKIQLESEIKSLNIVLDKPKINQLVEYISLLEKWNKVYNLTAIRNVNQMVTHHLLDSLSIVPWISGCSHILDVGSGAGLPGLVIAVSCPGMIVEMVDTVSKKTAFIRQAAIELGLNNVKVHTGRVESLSMTGTFDGIVSRAFSSLSDFVALSSYLLTEKGHLYAMKGLIPEDEISNLDKQWTIAKIVPLVVPGLDAQRHLVIIERNSPASTMETNQLKQ